MKKTPLTPKQKLAEGLEKTVAMQEDRLELAAIADDMVAAYRQRLKERVEGLRKLPYANEDLNIVYNEALDAILKLLAEEDI